MIQEISRNRKKGVSPLIAAVILIALTMAIAGLMAAFATNISGEKLVEAQQCSAGLVILDLDWANGSTTGTANISVRLANQNRAIPMEGITFSLIYGDGELNAESLDLSSSSSKTSDSIAAQSRESFYIDEVHYTTFTTNSVRPQKIEFVTATCPDITITGVI